MRQFIFIVLVLTASSGNIHSQNTADKFEIRMAAGFRQIDPKALKKWDTPSWAYIESITGTNVRPRRNYPGNIDFSGAVLYNFSFMRVGAEGEIFFSQGRLAYRDYAGKIAFNGELRSVITSVIVEKDLLRTGLRPGIGLGIGLDHKRWVHDIRYTNNYGTQDFAPTIRAHSTDISINPHIFLRYEAGRLFTFGLNAGYRFDLESPMEGRSEYFDSSYKFKSLMNGSGVKLKAELSGIYIRLFISEKL